MGCQLISKNYVTVEEAAKILNVSKFYIYAIIKGRTRKQRNGVDLVREPPKLRKTIKIHKETNTWYLINTHELLEFRNAREKKSK